LQSPNVLRLDFANLELGLAQAAVIKVEYWGLIGRPSVAVFVNCLVGLCALENIVTAP
jgi:hypothetical protein